MNYVDYRKIHVGMPKNMKKSPRRFAAFLVTLLVDTVCSYSDVLTNEEARDWYGAHLTCIHGARAGIAPWDDQNTTMTHMSNMNTTTVWTNIQRKSCPELIWTNGNKFEGKVSAHWHSNWEQCVVLDTKSSRAMESYDCGKRAAGYICSFDFDCRRYCDGESQGRLCFNYKKHCFLLDATKSSWHAAAFKCENLNGKILTKGGPALIKHLSHRARRLHSIIRKFWIGLSNSAWFSYDTGDLVTTKMNWLHREPKMEHNCVILVKTLNGLRLKSEDCKAKHRCICKRKNLNGSIKKQIGLEPKNLSTTFYGKEIRTDSRKKSESGKGKGQSDLCMGTAAILLVGFLSLIVGAGITTLLLIFKKKFSAKFQIKKPSENDETTMLASTQPKN